MLTQSDDKQFDAPSEEAATTNQNFPCGPSKHTRSAFPFLSPRRQGSVPSLAGDLSRSSYQSSDLAKTSRCVSSPPHKPKKIDMKIEQYKEWSELKRSLKLAPSTTPRSGPLATSKRQFGAERPSPSPSLPPTPTTRQAQEADTATEQPKQNTELKWSHGKRHSVADGQAVETERRNGVNRSDSDAEKNRSATNPRLFRFISLTRLRRPSRLLRTKSMIGLKRDRGVGETDLGAQPPPK